METQIKTSEEEFELLAQRKLMTVEKFGTSEEVQLLLDAIDLGRKLLLSNGENNGESLLKKLSAS